MMKEHLNTKYLCLSSRYQRECVELSQWLQSALERLEFWNTQAILVPQELETVRDHLSAFLVRLLVFFSPLSVLINRDSTFTPLNSISVIYRAL